MLPFANMGKDNSNLLQTNSRGTWHLALACGYTIRATVQFSTNIQLNPSDEQCHCKYLESAKRQSLSSKKSSQGGKSDEVQLELD